MEPKFEAMTAKFSILLDLIIPDESAKPIVESIVNAFDKFYDMDDDIRAALESQIDTDITTTTRALKLRLLNSFAENVEWYSNEIARLSCENKIVQELEVREKNNDNNGTDKVTTNNKEI